MCEISVIIDEWVTADGKVDRMLTKAQSVLDRNPFYDKRGFKAYDNSDPETNPSLIVMLDTERFADMDEPDHITVTIVPQDRLNLGT